MAGTSIQINQGTQSPVAGDSVGGTLYQTVKIDVGANGASSPFVGQLNPAPSSPITNFGTLGTAASATYGTLVAAPGIGTSLYINDLSIVSYSGTTDYMVAFGTGVTGAGVLARGLFAPSSGIEKVFPLANNGNLTNTPLVFWINGAGTGYINVSYFTK